MNPTPFEIITDLGQTVTLLIILYILAKRPKS